MKLTHKRQINENQSLSDFYSSHIIEKKMINKNIKLTRISTLTKNTEERKIKKTKKKKVIRPTELIKTERNPIISPQQNHEWEAWQTFNPGVIMLNNKIHFLYRAIGRDGISRLGYAASTDGFYIDERFPHPVYEHEVDQYAFCNLLSYCSGGSFGGVEDPRIVRVDEEDTLYLTYTACDRGLRMALSSIKVCDFLNKKWKWQSPVLISPPNEIHKNWVIFPEKINGKYAILHTISPQIGVAYFDMLEFNGEKYIHSQFNGKCGCENGCLWETYVRGVGPPPIKTKYGWLVFYHAMSADDFSKYKVGAMLLDLQEPTKIIVRSSEPILEPDQAYENNGFKPGVVYASGAVVKDHTLFVYYGCADSYVCVAWVNLNEFLETLMKRAKPQFERNFIKKKKTVRI